MIEEDVNIAVDEIQKDLFDRRGFRQAWDDCGQEIKQEITQVMYNHIMHTLLEQKD